MLDETFAESVVHRRSHRVLGARLLPFSYWHAANLDFIRSPIAGHPGRLSFAALHAAVECCRISYPVIPRPSRSRARFVTWLYGNRYAQELGRFAIYLKDYNAGPIYGTNENSEPLKCPWYLVAVCQLRLHDHKLTLKQAWDWPVGDGGWLNAANAEAKGFKPDILTPELREAFAKIGVTSF